MNTMDNIETWSQRSDVELDHKRSKEVLRDVVVLPIEELVGCEILKNPRVVLFGSSVTELKASNDLDAMLIYDGFDGFEFDTTLLSGVGEKMGVSIRAYEAELESDKAIISGHVHIAGVDMPIIRSDQFTRLFSCDDVTENRRLSLDRAARVFERVELLAEKIKSNIDGENERTEIDDWAEIAKGIPCLLLKVNGMSGEEYVSQLNSYRNIARRAMGIPEVTIAEDEVRRLEKEYLDNTVKSLLKINPDLGNVGQSLIASDTTNWTSLESKEFLADLVRLCTTRVETISRQEELEDAGYVISKGIRQLVTTFNLGVNFVQSSIRSGAVQIMGDSISDLSVSTDIPYDATLLNKEKIIRTEYDVTDGEFADFYNVVIQNPYFDHETRSRIVDVFGKKNALRYMLNESFGSSDLENIWNAIVNLVDPDEDWPEMIKLMTDERIMSVDHSSVRMALLRKMAEVSNPENLLGRVPDDLFRSVLLSLTARTAGFGDTLDHYEMVLKDVDLLLNVCKKIGIDLSVPETADFGRFDSKFLQGYVELLQGEECAEWPMVARARHVEVNNHCGMLTDLSVNQLESIPSYDTDDGWSISSTREEDDGPELDPKLQHYSFSGIGLSLGVWKINQVSELLLDGNREMLEGIVGDDVDAIGKIDFMPQGRTAFQWDSMTDSLLSGFRDFKALLTDLENGDIPLKWIGGYTNPQMASMAYRMGFEHVFLSLDERMYPLSSKQLRDLATARLANNDVKQQTVGKIGIAAIRGIDDIDMAYVFVLGVVDSIREKVQKLESAGIVNRLEVRHAINPGSGSSNDSNSY